jgi:hypothetical protein
MVTKIKDKDYKQDMLEVKKKFLWNLGSSIHTMNGVFGP